MATIKVCDRCEKRIGDDNANYNFVIIHPGSESISYDLCPECMASFREWLNSPKVIKDINDIVMGNCNAFKGTPKDIPKDTPKGTPKGDLDDLIIIEDTDDFDIYGDEYLDDPYEESGK